MRVRSRDPSPPHCGHPPGLLPRWEEVLSAQQKTNMDFSRKEGTWISYLGEKPISPTPCSLHAADT